MKARQQQQQQQQQQQRQQHCHYRNHKPVCVLMRARMAQPVHKAAVTPHDLSIRPYLHQDQPAVVDICKNVYNGSDYMPRMIQHFAERGETTVLVSQPGPGPEPGANSADAIHGLVCGHRRGSAWFLFGLRVAEHARGKGVARALMAEICSCSREHGGVAAITSATVPQNPAAVRLFEQLGFSHTHTVDMWPSYASLAAYEQAVGFVPGAPEQPMFHTSLIDHVQGAKELVSQASSSLGAQAEHWVQASSLQQLQQAVRSIRQQQRELVPEMRLVPEALPQDWLPWVYESWPLDSPYVQQQLQEGAIWLLQDPAAAVHHSASSSSMCSTTTSFSSSKSLGIANNSTPSSLSHSSSSQQLLGAAGLSVGRDGNPQQHYAAVVLAAWSPEFRRRCIGILTAGDAFVAPALDFIGSREPHFVSFVDRGSRHSSGRPDLSVVLPEVFNLTEGDSSCFIVYARNEGANADAAGEEVMLEECLN
ncbi:acyl-CoA N-acyltransferase [Scenedesmus sp. NREL 46B-D3]|nr:acyl-CoA N-acyltransferase [Scenedesmus sp. NREL 46B-D3]